MFLPRPPARGGRRIDPNVDLRGPWWRFNPRPHAAGDGHGMPWSRTGRCFNPRPHAAGDASARDPLPVDVVSIHARTRRATGSRYGDSPCRPRFNPRPHAAGDRAMAAAMVTCQKFQSTPARGGRRGCRQDITCVSKFQSTPARGGRRGTRSSPRQAASVSIHARTRRATPTQPCSNRMRVSIHARTRRATSYRQTFRLVPMLFQSTPARGGRRRIATTANRAGFNPRPHAAGDAATVVQRARLACFNPRPHAAGDASNPSATVPACMFQSTPARGGRRQPTSPQPAPTMFQSTPARGGRPSQ